MSSPIAVPDTVAVRRRTRQVLARVAVLLRVVALAPLVLAVLAGIHDQDYAEPWLAGLIYLVFAVWTSVFVLLAWRRGAISTMLQIADVALIGGCLLLIAAAVRPGYFVHVSSSDFEPAIIVAAVTTTAPAAPWKPPRGRSASSRPPSGSTCAASTASSPTRATRSPTGSSWPNERGTTRHRNNSGRAPTFARAGKPIDLK